VFVGEGATIVAPPRGGNLTPASRRVIPPGAVRRLDCRRTFRCGPPDRSLRSCAAREPVPPLLTEDEAEGARRAAAPGRRRDQGNGTRIAGNRIARRGTDRLGSCPRHCRGAPPRRPVPGGLRGRRLPARATTGTLHPLGLRDALCRESSPPQRIAARCLARRAGGKQAPADARSLPPRRQASLGEFAAPVGADLSLRFSLPAIPSP